MPKLYFYDLGLRNFLVNNFEPILIRSDRGALLENAVVRQLTERAGLAVGDQMKFWRYHTGAEVDIIFTGKIAFEIKFTPKLLKKSRYRMFLERYPDIKFNLVSLTDIHQGEIPVWEPWLL